MPMCATVAKAVLGDFLNVNYTLGAGVQGTITVQTSKPLARTEVMPVFEQILRMNGLAIIRTAGVYKIVTSADAPREVSAPRVPPSPGGGAEAGYGTQVVPLHFIAAAEMQRLLEGMQPAQAIVHARHRPQSPHRAGHADRTRRRRRRGRPVRRRLAGGDVVRPVHAQIHRRARAWRRN